MSVSRSLRRVEILLWSAGFVLLTVAIGATVARWSYQTQQERALFLREPAVSATPVVEDRRSRLSGQAGLPVLHIKEPVVEDRRSRLSGQARLPVLHVKEDPTAFGRIEIPRLGLSAIVKEGADEKTLSRAVGLVPGSPRPGHDGNVVLAGHRDTFFRPLRKIKLNDRIRVVVPPHTYEYRVQSLRVVTPEETSVLESKGMDELTLVTCYPFRFVGPAPDRFIVNATRVN